MRKPTLHIPQVPARPGEKPDFSYLRLSPAGSLPCPPITVSVDATHDLANGLVRVLDDEHRARGPWDPKLEAGALIEGLRWMLTTRLFTKRPDIERDSTLPLQTTRQR